MFSQKKKKNTEKNGGGGGGGQLHFKYLKHFSVSALRTVPTFVTAHTFCASGDTRVSYGWCLLIQGYFWAV